MFANAREQHMNDIIFNQQLSAWQPQNQPEFNQSFQVFLKLLFMHALYFLVKKEYVGVNLVLVCLYEAWKFDDNFIKFLTKIGS